MSLETAQLQQWITGVFAQCLPPLVARTQHDHVSALTRHFVEAIEQDPLLHRGASEELLGQVVSVAAIAASERAQDRIDQRRHRLSRLRMRLQILDQQEAQHALLDFLCELEGRRKPDPGNRRALRRWLDLGAVEERAVYAEAHDRWRLCCCLYIAGAAASRMAYVPHNLGERLEATRLWQVCCAAWQPDQVRSVGEAAARCIEQVASALGARAQDLIPITVRDLLLSLARDELRPTWLRIAAWRAWFAAVNFTQLQTIQAFLHQERTRRDHSVYIRSALLDLLAQRAPETPIAQILGETLRHDQSLHVRQTAIRGLAGQFLPVFEHGIDPVLGYRTHRGDPDPRLRASAILALCARPVHGQEIMWTVERLLWMMRYETASLPLRALLSGLDQVMPLISPPEDGFTPICCSVLAALYRLRNQTAVDLPIRRLVSEHIERIIVPRDAQTSTYVQQVRPLERTLMRGQRLRLQASYAPEALARTFSLLGSSGMGWSFRQDRKGRSIVQHGDCFAVRLWRLWHEIRNPAPDKRQGHHHAVGRVYAGPWRAHALWLGEQSPTRTPGEPLFMEPEGQWRRHLPLVDDALDACSWSGEPVRVVSAHGITTLSARGNRWRRMRWRWNISLAYARLARLRNRPIRADDQRHARAYLAALRACNLEIVFTPWPPPVQELATDHPDDDLLALFHEAAEPSA